MKNLLNVNLIVAVIVAISIAFFLGFIIGKNGTTKVYSPPKNISDSLKVLNGSYVASIVGEISIINNNTITLRNKDQQQATFSLSKNITVTAPYVEDVKLSITPTVIVNEQKLRFRIASKEELRIGQTVSATLSISPKDISVKSIYIVSNK